MTDIYSWQSPNPQLAIIHPMQYIFPLPVIQSGERIHFPCSRARRYLMVLYLAFWSDPHVDVTTWVTLGSKSPSNSTSKCLQKDFNLLEKNSGGFVTRRTIRLDLLFFVVLPLFRSFVGQWRPAKVSMGARMAFSYKSKDKRSTFLIEESEKTETIEVISQTSILKYQKQDKHASIMLIAGIICMHELLPSSCAHSDF